MLMILTMVDWRQCWLRKSTMVSGRIILMVLTLVDWRQCWLMKSTTVSGRIFFMVLTLDDRRQCWLRNPPLCLKGYFLWHWLWLTGGSDGWGSPLWCLEGFCWLYWPRLTGGRVGWGNPPWCLKGYFLWYWPWLTGGRGGWESPPWCPEGFVDNTDLGWLEAVLVEKVLHVVQKDLFIILTLVDWRQCWLRKSSMVSGRILLMGTSPHRFFIPILAPRSSSWRTTSWTWLALGRVCHHLNPYSFDWRIYLGPILCNQKGEVWKILNNITFNGNCCWLAWLHFCVA